MTAMRVDASFVLKTYKAAIHNPQLVKELVIRAGSDYARLTEHLRSNLDCDEVDASNIAEVLNVLGELGFNNDEISILMFAAGCEYQQSIIDQKQGASARWKEIERFFRDCSWGG